jgi:hypothetical protein
MLRTTLSALIIFAPVLTQAAEDDNTGNTDKTFTGGGTGWYVPTDGSKVFRVPGVDIGIRRQPSTPSAPVPMDDMEQRMEQERMRQRMIRELQRRRLEQEQQRRRKMDKEKLHRLPQPDIGIRKAPENQHPEDPATGQ